VKRLFGYGVTAVASLVIGASSGAILVRKNCDRALGRWYVMELLDKANVAHEIYAGRSQQLADRIRENLPQYVLAVEGEFPSDSGRHAAYRMVRRVYEASSAELPPSIQAIVAAVPARPSEKEAR
jgi:hypothetical protein